MQYYEMYAPDTAELRDFIASQRQAILVCSTQEGRLLTGLFPVHQESDECFVLHFNATDEQVTALRSNPAACLVFHDVPSFLRSYWSHPEDAGNATLWYRYAELSCSAEFMESPEDKAQVLQKMMESWQPEGGYRPVTTEHYARALAVLALVRFQVKSVRSKWKQGQNKSPEIRERMRRSLAEERSR